ncbi:MAG TPA: hypothetical protein ENN13_03945 [Candidatus Altiarchaeales archaeon]|nr:hypothetical protein [Candidatus Altiarchaeales archaeon]
MKDLREKLASTVNTGKIVYGYKETVEKLYFDSPLLVITSANCPSPMNDRLKYLCALNKTPFLHSGENNQDLGGICARPHGVSVLAVINAGESSILEGLK